MFRAPVRLLLPLGLVLACLLAAPSGADAGVLVLGSDGETRQRTDPGVGAFGEWTRAAGGRRARAGTRRDGARASVSRKRRRSVASELRRMRDAGAIDAFECRERLDAYRDARDFVGRIPPGRRRMEMAAAVRLVKRAARGGWLIVSRLEPLWRTLEANREWWSEGPLLAPGRRVGFEDSELVWQYVPDQGLQLHPLANFGKLNALWRSRGERRLTLLLDELLELPASRAGGLAWEYYFDFGGGRAPWVSGLAQGTGLQALARTASKLGREAEVLPVAAQGLAVFEAAPPEGVRVRTPRGAHYLLYSFSSGLRVINGFVQAVVGLHDYASIAGDQRALRLFAEGERQARSEVPRHDTGAWSLYSQFRESDLHYHELLMGFLESLCDRTQEPAYCSTRANFEHYLDEPPELQLVTRRLRGGRTGVVRFDLSKISTVNLEILRGDRVVRSATLRMGRGRRAFTWDVPRRARRYEVRLGAVDLAGNRAGVEGEVRVLRPKRPRRR